MQRRNPEAMDVESTHFKSYQQVSGTWSRFMVAGVLGALVIAFIALIIGSVALNKANDNESSSSGSGGVVERNTAETTPPGNQAPGSTPSEPEPAAPGRVLPGNPNYTGFQNTQRPSRRRFDVITHGHISESYFNLLQKGIDDAAQALNVDVSYLNPTEPGDHDEIVDFITQARRELRDGLAVSLLEHTTELGEALQEATFDMPVMSMLLDEDVYDGIEVDMFADLGFSFRLAGIFAARRFKDAGIESALCVLTPGNIFGHREACNAFADEFEPGTSDTVVMEEASVAEDVISNRRLNRDNVRGILTITKETFSITHEYLSDNDRLCNSQSNSNDADCITLATFEADNEILEAIQDGTVAFAIDRQDYVQGYLAVLFLSLRSFFHLRPGGGSVVLTGPRIINGTEEVTRRLSRDIMNSETIENKNVSDLDIRFIVHGKTSDEFWTQVKGGLRAAVRSTHIGIDFRHPDSGAVTPEDIVRSHISMLQEAREDDVDALVLTLPSNDTDLLAEVQAVADSGIPIFTINAGHRWFQNLSIQAHVGLIEFETGREVAERLNDLGVEKILCVVADKANRDLEHRCETIGTEDYGIEVEILDSDEDGNEFHTDMDDLDELIKDAVVARLRNDSDIKAVISTGLIATEAVREALAQEEKFCRGSERPTNSNDSCIEFGAYDLSDIVFTYILNDELNFAVDQQPELQGYLPVYFAIMEVLYGTSPIGAVSSGPRFVDRRNVIFSETIFGFLSTN